MLRSLFYSIINAIIPMRSTEVCVASLSTEALEQLRHSDGLPYHDPRVTALVWEVKYKASTHALQLAGAYLAEELLGIAQEELGTIMLVPVPMHAERRKARGYNQTELLCKAALAQTKSDGFEYAPWALERTKNAAPQQTLARHKRLHNVKNSMYAPQPEKIKGKVCIVVDDVATTGATLAEASRALMCAGARKVHLVALARS